MEDIIELLERRIPDVVSTVGLPVRLAAEIDFLAGRVDTWCDPSEEYPPAITARSLAARGRTVEAARLLRQVDVAGAELADLAAAAWAASRVGGPVVPALLARLDAETSEFLDGEIPAGPRRMFVGMLHGASGDISRAVHELEAAVAVGDARAPLWGALGRLELGRVLRTAASIPVPGTRPAEPVLAAARTFFLAGGYRWLLHRVEAASGPVEARIEFTGPSRVGLGVQPAAEVRSGKGLVAIAHLVSNADRVVSAAELAAIVDGRDASDVVAFATDALMATESDFDVDVDVSRSIRSVLFDEATRSRITKLLRRTIESLSSSHRLVGEHLAASVVTGHGCRYRATGAPVTWRIERDA